MVGHSSLVATGCYKGNVSGHNYTLRLNSSHSEQDSGDVLILQKPSKV